MVLMITTYSGPSLSGSQGDTLVQGYPSRHIHASALVRVVGLKVRSQKTAQTEFHHGIVLYGA